VRYLGEVGDCCSSEHFCTLTIRGEHVTFEPAGKDVVESDETKLAWVG
jgi:hypothetical protein